MDQQYNLNAYTFHLPESSIARYPVPERSTSRLLALNRRMGDIAHRSFSNILEYLEPEDCLIINDSRVFPARIRTKKPTGGRVEFLLLHFPLVTDHGGAVVTALCRSSKPLKSGQTLELGSDLTIQVVESLENGQIRLKLHFDGELEPILERHGEIPLPPYIDRPATDEDKKTYQTVYAQRTGSVAAPTAGLHFDEAVLTNIQERGVAIGHVTLHVGYGTFAPIKTQDIRNHKIHSEWISVPPETQKLIRDTKRRGGRVIAVGTTSVRTLEFWAQHTNIFAFQENSPSAFEAMCDLYILPGFQFQVVNAMLTNFHLPGSSLLVLVSAFAGKELIMKAYKEAMEQGYRFYSYGDAMLIL
ncbi:MAG: tRNA preQ1(34) S-adenosylmethionine ribosyltransferase-isomerase QueA [Dissulfuribacterales bacterium]